MVFKLFDKVFVMEKIHGTSTWIKYVAKTGELTFHSGGEKSDNFHKLFDQDKLRQMMKSLVELKSWKVLKIHGECYGWKQQGMAKTYGEVLKFIVFDVYVEAESPISVTNFMNIPEAESVATSLGLEFVHYVVSECKPELLEHLSSLESVQAVRNGMGHDIMPEGIVVRPISEAKFEDGKRVIAKYKNEKFWEIKSRRPLGESLKVFSDTNEFVSEFVTEERIRHVLDRILQTKENKIVSKSDIKNFITLMLEDIQRESEGEIIWSEDIEKAIRKKAGTLFVQKYIK
jgi:hypothetical protein